MNCPTKDTSKSYISGYNQNPSPLDNDLITNSQLNSSPSNSNQKSNSVNPLIKPSMSSDPSTSLPNSATLPDPGNKSGAVAAEGLETPNCKTEISPSSNNFALSSTDSAINAQPIPIAKSLSQETTPLRTSPSNHITPFGGLDSNTRPSCSSSSSLSSLSDAENPFNDSHDSTFEPRSQQTSTLFNSTNTQSNNSPFINGYISSSPEFTSRNSGHFFSGVSQRLRSFFNSNRGFTPLNNNLQNNNQPRSRHIHTSPISSRIERIGRIFFKYLKFVGPSIILSVAYMDPGNYVTAVSAGAMYKYKLLFIILISNIFAVFLQALCIKLGSVTGLDLAQNCREHLPRGLNITIYIMAEIAIIATDLAEVVGTAISLDILFGIPLAVGVCLTIIDVLIILMAYRPNGEMKIVRYFEYLVSTLVFFTVICFAIELGNIGPVSPGEIFRGFLPSGVLFETQGLYLSCGILGATVMPHSLYLGSGLVQPRLRDFDKKHGYFKEEEDEGNNEVAITKYKPSIHAINYGMKYSIAELIISLSTVAIFVNSSILIVAGSTLANTPEAIDADLYSIYDMLRTLLSPAAGTVFALALLFSGQSAGIVCTLAGQMVAEGFIAWTVKPWIRRLITRSIAVIPCFVLSIFVGRKGLADVLTASQVVLSLLLPFVSAPLIFFTAKKSIMRVPVLPSGSSGQPLQHTNSYSAVSRHPPTSGFAESSAPESSSRSFASLSPTQTLTDSRNDEVAPLTNSEDDSDGAGYQDIIIATTRRISEDHQRRQRQSMSFEHVRPSTSIDIPHRISEERDEEEIEDDDMSSIMIPAYKDMSNSIITNVAAVIILTLITGLNFFLIVSAALGENVHF